jgi:iron-sulfur cluster assembly protein
MITITEKAAKQLIDHITHVDGAIGIRVGVMGGGCSGFQYQLDFAMIKRDDDIEYEDKGITLLVDPRSDMFLKDMVIDYVSDLMQSGFKFINPAATRTCGCGESFSC